ncbi:glycosyltransferase [Streptomyces hokutonensis]|uniref:glycosyltransferase n=1 Tax=Streptomyces hokutonensis TaxID=1306990 RepID=UPI0038276E5F
MISDTGSTDGTQDLIRKVLDGVPGELHEEPWVDFGHNRTRNIRLAHGRADYLLTLDADHVLRQDAPLPRPHQMLEPVLGAGTVVAQHVRARRGRLAVALRGGHARVPVHRRGRHPEEPERPRHRGPTPNATSGTRRRRSLSTSVAPGWAAGARRSTARSWKRSPAGGADRRLAGRDGRVLPGVGRTPSTAGRLLRVGVPPASRRPLPHRVRPAL